ncbi:36407_t:CDS:1, partial [Racocetra persica]
NNSKALKKLLPSLDNWIVLEELILLLQPFADAINLTSSNIYSTLLLCYPTLFCLR